MHHHRPDHDVPEIPGLTIGAMVGRGGNAAVYAAHQHHHDRPVAVKILNAHMDAAARRRFDRERIALGRVSSHPGVVTLIGSGTTTTGRAFLILEWASGGTLAQLLAARGPVGSDDATALGIQLAAALEQSHRCGVLHRDVTPANVMRSEYGRWLLADFGVASASDGSDATATISVTFAHCAPESFSSERSTPAADVYSLASVIRTALTDTEPNGIRPGETMAQAMARIASVPTTRPSREAIDGDLADLLAEALDLDPARRPTMRSFAARLAELRWASGLDPVSFVVRPDATVSIGGDAEPATRNTPSLSGIDEIPHAAEVGGRRIGRSTHARRSPRRRRHLAGWVASLAILGGVAGGGLASGSFDDPLAEGLLAASMVMPTPEPDSEETATDTTTPDTAVPEAGPDADDASESSDDEIASLLSEDERRDGGPDGQRDNGGPPSGGRDGDDARR